MNKDSIKLMPSRSEWKDKVELIEKSLTLDALKLNNQETRLMKVEYKILEIENEIENLKHAIVWVLALAACAIVGMGLIAIR